MTPRPLAGVLGHPVAHSLSPAMQNAAFRAAGLDWHYVKLPVPPERFDEVVRALPASGYRGANVTIPHKVAALEVADSASPAAKAIGAANTLSFHEGSIEAENTDAAGLVAAVGAPLEGLRALVLGAGGAGRAAAWAMKGEGAHVSLWNRTRQRAEALARELDIAAVEQPETAGVDLLVNATSVGLDPGSAAKEALSTLHLHGAEVPPTVVDLVYRSDGSETPVIAWARRAGARVVDGIEVLVQQGARSFELWTGQTAPLDVMRAAVRNSLP
jgi:shikimate dehydrogenase